MPYKSVPILKIPKGTQTHGALDSFLQAIKSEFRYGGSMLVTLSNGDDLQIKEYRLDAVCGRASQLAGHLESNGDVVVTATIRPCGPHAQTLVDAMEQNTGRINLKVTSRIGNPPIAFYKNPTDRFSYLNLDLGDNG